MPRSLYICYFGLREPLVQTQVLPYLREIKKGGTEVSILTFEPDPATRWTDDEIAAERAGLAAEGIKWDFLTYHKRPSVPATVFDILCGALHIRRRIRREGIDVLHARVHTPALMGALAKILAFGSKPRLIFDIRGFFPEEYVDAGIWPANGLVFRTVKRLEGWLIKRSDAFVVLTERAREIMFPDSRETGRDRNGRPVEVIPCCVDLSRFAGAGSESRARIRERLGLGERFVTTYIGAFGGWYLTAETADFFGVLKRLRPDTFALILTQSDPEIIKRPLLERGFGEDDMFVGRVTPAEIPEYLSTADAAVSFIKKCYSKQASSPTKNAEYLACGLPIVANDGIGDTDQFTIEDRNGVIVRGFDSDELERAAGELFKMLAEPGVADRCRESSHRRFDLEKIGGERYRRLYSRLENES